MTYFELFKIPASLKVDTVKLRPLFFELSRRYHPDFFTRADPAEQAEALEISALLNQAWKTFENPDATIQYVLKSKGLLEEEEKYELPAEFLAEVMELNEELMDNENSPAPSFHGRIKEIQHEIYQPVQQIIENYAEGSTSQEELLQVKEYYFKKKYLDRIQDQLGPGFKDSGK